MDTIARRVVRTIERRALYRPEDRVAIALSGGADSVSLVWLLREIGAEGGATVAGLIHINHLLRGDESDEDERFCGALATRVGWPIEIARVDVGQRAREHRQSIEVAARLARYQFLGDAARRLDATVVATGHTLEDQAETVLLRLVRGAGTRGLSGIRPRRGQFVRPLIDCHRQDLRRYLEARGEPFRHDSSNRSLAIPRNRIRHELLPLLVRLAPGSVRSLARLASLATDDEAYLTSTAIESRRFVVLSEGRGESTGGQPGSATTVSASALQRLAPALGRRLVRELAAEIVPHAALTAAHLDAVWELAGADSSKGHLDLPRLSVERQGDVLTLGAVGRGGESRRHRPPLQAAEGGVSRPLAVPGSVSLPEAGVTITAAVESNPAGLAFAGRDASIAMLQASTVSAPLSVRYWRAGDRFRPLGAPGRRKLQDVFVDRKVPRDERRQVPLVVDTMGRILWVAGVAVAEECRVTAPEAGMVILEMRKQQ